MTQQMGRKRKRCTARDALRLGVSSLLLFMIGYALAGEEEFHENDVENAIAAARVVSPAEQANRDAAEVRLSETRNKAFELWWLMRPNICVAMLPAASWKRDGFEGGEVAFTGSAVIFETLKGECRPDFRFRRAKHHKDYPPLDKRMLFGFRHDMPIERFDLPSTHTYLLTWGVINDDWLSLIRRRAESKVPLKH